MSWYNPFSWGRKSDEEIRRESQFQDRDYIMNQLQQGLGSVGGRAAPTAQAANAGGAAQIAQGPQNQFRGMEMAQANSLLAQALGNQKGAGELATERQVARGTAGAQAMARMGRGGAAPMAGLNAARNIVDITGAGAGQAQQAALQDRQSANAQLSQVLGQGRGADIGLATSQAGLNQGQGQFNAGLQQQTNLANLQSQLQQTGMNDAAINAYLSQLLGMNQSELAARSGMQQNNQGYFGSMLSAGGQILGGYLGRPGG